MRDERIDVAEVVYAYATGVDTRDWGLYRSIFTDEVEFDFSSFDGNPARHMRADDWVAGVQLLFHEFDATQHSMTNPRVEIAGERASCVMYMQAGHFLRNDEGVGFAGRLKLRSSYRGRATRVNFENYYPSFEVQEILREPYSGRSFLGFEDIDVSFEELEALVRNSRPDWRAALSSVKGVYLISDIKTGKRYVGSAYGDQGIWSRWSAYAATGHGGNVELRALVKEPTLKYCRESFRFALLEARPSPTPDEVIIGREAFWKRILLSRGDCGLNRN